MDITIPFTQCDECTEAGQAGQIVFSFERRRLKVNHAELHCTTCDWRYDLLESMKAQPEKAAKRTRHISKEFSQLIVSMKGELPKNRSELRAAISNPNHPFTALVLTGLLLLAMQLSGFGVFMFVAWMLGNLILNPLGWVLVPIVVAIAFAFKRYFERQNLEVLRGENQKLVERLQRGEIDQKEFEQLQRQLFHDYLSKKLPTAKT